MANIQICIKEWYMTAGCGGGRKAGLLIMKQVAQIATTLQYVKLLHQLMGPLFAWQQG